MRKKQVPSLVRMGSERALDGKSGTTPVREGMARDPGLAPISGKNLNSLVAGKVAMADGRSRAARPSTDRCVTAWRQRADSVNLIFSLRALAARNPAAPPRNFCCIAEAIAVIHAVCSKSEAADSQPPDKIAIRCAAEN